eukprot:22669-Chlamydomonas_euryale.AAC.1
MQCHMLPADVVCCVAVQDAQHAKASLEAELASARAAVASAEAAAAEAAKERDASTQKAAESERALRAAQRMAKGAATSGAATQVCGPRLSELAWTWPVLGGMGRRGGRGRVAPASLAHGCLLALYLMRAHVATAH